ncbi:MAG: hypothetical protein JWL97_1453, partial [Gemmatimonadales bacterium]|nr:hypothetical protein [Gemmatimonadales bacterium]
EYADEPTQDQLKTTLRVLRRDFRDGRLFSYDQLQFRNQIHNELTIRI